MSKDNHECRSDKAIAKLAKRWEFTKQDRFYSLSSINQEKATAIKAYRKLVKQRKEQERNNPKEDMIYFLD